MPLVKSNGFEVNPISSRGACLLDVSFFTGSMVKVTLYMHVLQYILHHPERIQLIQNILRFILFDLSSIIIFRNTEQEYNVRLI